MRNVIRARSVRIAWASGTGVWNIRIEGASGYTITDTIPAANYKTTDDMLLRLAARVLMLDNLSMPPLERITIIR